MAAETAVVATTEEEGEKETTAATGNGRYACEVTRSRKNPDFRNVSATRCPGTCTDSFEKVAPLNPFTSCSSRMILKGTSFDTYSKNCVKISHRGSLCAALFRSNFISARREQFAKEFYREEKLFNSKFRKTAETLFYLRILHYSLSFSLYFYVTL